ncbi:hypothetical protein E2C01_061331 [Portunus trituberculatus]|uniref:Uncharacterized protein n=1 Tax=Portunus trituberculatus TaxID=210409 RepID=A0A5B7HC57_PORTR|nr:hypothetical protein [Portunus trituberculatus]
MSRHVKREAGNQEERCIFEPVQYTPCKPSSRVLSQGLLRGRVSRGTYQRLTPLSYQRCVLGLS